jgi:hypothetical protein
VRVAVSREEHHLEKQHTRRPHAGTAAKPWQDEFADHGLDLKEQEGTQQTDEAKNIDHGLVGDEAGGCFEAQA